VANTKPLHISGLPMTTQPTVAAAPTAPIAGQPAPTPATSDILPYAYSMGNAFVAFPKFNGKNYFAWRRKMETQLRALGQWEAVNRNTTAPGPVNVGNPTADETRQLEAWKLWAAQAYAEIVLCLDNDYGEVIDTITDVTLTLHGHCWKRASACSSQVFNPLSMRSLHWRNGTATSLLTSIATT